jgi:predicted CoA-binding protein
MAYQPPSNEAIKKLLLETKTIAVVGLSPKPSRVSYSVSRTMQGFGYRIIPVRPDGGEILGEAVYKNLEAIGEPIDVVNVFRASRFVSDIIDDCIRQKRKVIWLQEGVINEAAADRAQKNGLFVVMDRCIYKDHVRFIGHNTK